MNGCNKIKIRKKIFFNNIKIIIKKVLKSIILIIYLIRNNKNKFYSRIGLINLLESFFSSFSFEFSFSLRKIEMFSSLCEVVLELRSIIT